MTRVNYNTHISYIMNRLYSFLLSVATCMSAGAVEIKDVFAAMPDSVLPTLTRNNRLDMVDFVASGMKAEVSDVCRLSSPHSQQCSEG